jgi:hypothetical protein
MIGPVARLDEWIERDWSRDALRLKTKIYGPSLILEVQDEVQVATPSPRDGAKMRLYRYVVVGIQEDGRVADLLLQGPLDTDIAFGDACPACGAPMTEACQPFRELRGFSHQIDVLPIGPPLYSCGNAEHWSPASVATMTAIRAATGKK